MVKEYTLYDFNYINSIFSHKKAPTPDSFTSEFNFQIQDNFSALQMVLEH